MRDGQPSELVETVANGAPLDLDPQPRLIIYGFSDADVGGTSAWKKHEEVLRAKTTVIMAPTAQEVVLPWMLTALHASIPRGRPP